MKLPDDKFGATAILRRAYFIYVDEKVLSGQRRATELLIEELSARGWDCRRLGMPGLDRRGFLPFALLRFLFELCKSWWRVLVNYSTAPGIIHVNLGQSVPALLREGIPLMLSSFFYRQSRAVVSLHGSWFMRWPKKSLKARWLTGIIHRANVVTVLGQDQKQQLVSFGIAESKIQSVDNTCELSPLAIDVIEAKHRAARKVQVLFLSNLVDTKGYPEYLEALEIYSHLPEAPKIDAILCGQLVSAGHSTRLKSEYAAREFITGKMHAIEQTGKVSVRWVPEAEGVEKERLFANTAIFVFPSKLEAQPLVLLEAMATGCAIITSTVGQIPHMIDAAHSVQLPIPLADQVAKALLCLVKDANRRCEMALGGVRRFTEAFTRQRYGDRWSQIMNSLAEGSEHAALGSLPLLWFAFADTPGFSGQKEASRLVYENIRYPSRRIGLLRMPALDRSGNMLSGLSRYMLQLFQAFSAILKAAFSAESMLYVTLGQTRLALLRDAVPLLLIMGLHPKKRAVVSLHGSNFMDWRADCSEARWFKLIMSQANYLTVLGEKQRQQAIKLGIPEAKVLIVPNTSDAIGLPEEEILTKHAITEPATILHLSSLIDTKGYPVFLEALLILSKKKGPRIEAILCGNVVMSQFGVRFSSKSEAELWIGGMLAKINDSDRVHVNWVPGARGEAKWELYRRAQIFVFPSIYPVEAQPLVLLEAMTHGCAILTTDVGEIRSILTGDQASFLTETSPETVSIEIERLVCERDMRINMVRAAWRRYSEDFTLASYVNRWEGLFKELEK